MEDKYGKSISHLIDDKITAASVGMNSLDHCGNLRVVAFLACVCSACSDVPKHLSGKPDRSAMTGLLASFVFPAASSYTKNYTHGP